MNIYLDINGVLLDSRVKPALVASEFLEFVLWNWPESTYWLTTHCWKGENRAIEVLQPHFKPDIIKLARKIKPASWENIKTDGIDFKKPFLWFDDNLFPEESRILEHYNALDCLHKIDLKNNPAQLMDEINYLKALLLR